MCYFLLLGVIFVLLLDCASQEGDVPEGVEAFIRGEDDSPRQLRRVGVRQILHAKGTPVPKADEIFEHPVEP